MIGDEIVSFSFILAYHIMINTMMVASKLKTSLS